MGRFSHHLFFIIETLPFSFTPQIHALPVHAWDWLYLFTGLALVVNWALCFWLCSVHCLPQFWGFVTVVASVVDTWHGEDRACTTNQSAVHLSRAGASCSIGPQRRHSEWSKRKRRLSLTGTVLSASDCFSSRRTGGTQEAGVEAWLHIRMPSVQGVEWPW